MDIVREWAAEGKLKARDKKGACHLAADEDHGA